MSTRSPVGSEPRPREIKGNSSLLPRMGNPISLAGYIHYIMQVDIYTKTTRKGSRTPTLLPVLSKPWKLPLYLPETVLKVLVNLGAKSWCRQDRRAIQSRHIRVEIQRPCRWSASLSKNAYAASSRKVLIQPPALSCSHLGPVLVIPRYGQPRHNHRDDSRLRPDQRIALVRPPQIISTQRCALRR